MRKVLASMDPGMAGLLRRVAVDPTLAAHEVHGPVLKGLMVRGLVWISDNRLTVTWVGQQVLDHMEE